MTPTTERALPGAARDFQALGTQQPPIMQGELPRFRPFHDRVQLVPFVIRGLKFNLQLLERWEILECRAPYIVREREQVSSYLRSDVFVHLSDRRLELGRVSVGIYDERVVSFIPPPICLPDGDP